MDAEFLAAVVGLVSAVGGAGGAWGAAHARIKGTERQLLSVESKLAQHDARTIEVGERLVRIETLLEQIDKRIA